MNLTQWSIVMFVSTAAYYCFIYFSMFSKLNMFKFFILGIVWVLHEIVTLIYGINTKQIGFIMIFFLDWLILIAIFAISGRYIKNEDQ